MTDLMHMTHVKLAPPSSHLWDISASDSQQQGVRLLSCVAVVGLVLVMTVHTGFYALVYKRTDRARKWCGAADERCPCRPGARDRGKGGGPRGRGRRGPRNWSPSSTCDGASTDADQREVSATSSSSSWSSSDTDGGGGPDGIETTTYVCGGGGGLERDPVSATSSGWASHFVPPKR